MTAQRYQWRTATCEMCLTEFRSSRSDARFCSPNCRKAWSRRAEAIRRAVGAAQMACQQISDVAQRYPDLWQECQQAAREVRQMAEQAERRTGEAATRLKA